MTSSPAIYSILAHDSNVLGLICEFESQPAIFPNVLPAGSVIYPAIVYQTSSGKPVANSSAGPGRIFTQKVVVTCLARSPDDAAALADAAETVLSEVVGVVAGVNIRSIWVDDESASEEGLAATGDEFDVHKVDLVMDVTFKG